MSSDTGQEHTQPHEAAEIFMLQDRHLQTGGQQQRLRPDGVAEDGDNSRSVIAEGNLRSGSTPEAPANVLGPATLANGPPTNKRKAVDDKPDDDAGIDSGGVNGHSGTSRVVPKRPRRGSGSGNETTAEFQRAQDSTAEGSGNMTLQTQESSISLCNVTTGSTTPANTPPKNRQQPITIPTPPATGQRSLPRPRPVRLHVETLSQDLRGVEVPTGEAGKAVAPPPSESAGPIAPPGEPIRCDRRNRADVPPKSSSSNAHAAFDHNPSSREDAGEPHIQQLLNRSSTPEGVGVGTSTEGKQSSSRARRASESSNSSETPIPGPSRKDKGKGREIPVEDNGDDEEVPSTRADIHGLRSDLRSLGNSVQGLGNAMMAMAEQQQGLLETIAKYAETMGGTDGKRRVRATKAAWAADEDAMDVDGGVGPDQDDEEEDADDEEDVRPARSSRKVPYKKTTFPHRRSPEHNALLAAVRDLTMRYMRRKHAKAPFDLGKVPTREETDEYAENEDEDQGPCCTVEDFRPDLNGTAASAWNKSVTEVFVEGYLEEGGFPCNDERQISRCFYRHLKYLIKKFKECYTEKDVIKANLKRRCRRERRSYLFHRRLLACHSDPDLQRHIRIFERLGAEAMSSDESAGENGIKQFRILKKEWQNPLLTQWLRVFDGIARENRINPITETSRGAEPRQRFSSGKVDNRSPAVGYLPLSAYNEAWLSSLSEHMRKRLHVRKDYDFSHEEEVELRADKANGRHVARRAVRFR